MKLLLLIFLLILCSHTFAQNVRVAVASNFVPTLHILAPIFQKQFDDKLLISSASTGKHYAKVINGAPFDVLLAADRDFITKLDALGHVNSESRFIYAHGQLVLWSRNSAQLTDKDSLIKNDAKYIAIANPKTAPYGRATEQVLVHLDQWQKIKTKLVKGENIAQTFQFVASGNAELGFVALSQVLNPRNPFNKERYWLIPQTYYSPLVQEAALLRHGEKNPAAIRFLEFLKSPEAIEIIQRYGYR